MVNKNILEKQTYETTDLSLAAAILIYYPLATVKREENNKVVFVFEKDKNFDLILERFWYGELLLEPKRYYGNIKILKNRIYNK